MTDADWRYNDEAIQEIKNLGSVLRDDGKGDTEIRMVQWNSTCISKNKNIYIYTYQKAGKFCRSKEKVAELLCGINLPISQSGPDGFVTNEAETWSNKDVVSQKDDENFIDRDCEQQGKWMQKR